MKKNPERERVPQGRRLLLFYFERGTPLIVLLIFMALLFLIWPVEGLAFSTEEELLFFIPKKDFDEFAIIYEHSVMRTEVKDVFALEKGEILLLRTEYQSFGAGLPTEAHESFRQVGDRFINEGINQRIPKIRMRTGKTTDHRLIYNEDVQIAFNDYVEAGSVILIEEKTMTTLESLFY